MARKDSAKGGPVKVTRGTKEAKETKETKERLTKLKQRESNEPSISFIENLSEIFPNGIPCTTISCTSPSPSTQNDNRNSKILNDPFLSNLVDPLCIRTIVEIPRKIEKLLKEREEVGFIYRIVEGDKIRIMPRDDSKGSGSKESCKEGESDNRDKVRERNDSKGSGNDSKGSGNNSHMEMGVFEYKERERIEKEIEENKITVIYGKNKFKQEMKNRNNKMMREMKTESIEEENNKIVYLNKQIETKNNIYFIEDGEELNDLIKNLIKMIGRNRRYLPKTKTYENKEELYLNLLTKIKGITETVAKALIRNYPSLRELKEALEERKEEVINLRVGVDTTRIVGKGVYERMRGVFL